MWGSVAVLRLAVTGNIACGKNLIGSFLQEKGYSVIDSDEVVREILASPNRISDRVLSLCGSRVLAKDGGSYIDRKELASLIFHNPGLRKRVEEIIHPQVREQVVFFLAQCERRKEELTANLIPLLFETNSQTGYDCSWLVYCEAKEQLRRLRKRSPHLTEEEARNRIDAQMPQEEKLALADFVIDNSGEEPRTRNQFERVLEQTRRLEV
jgi:dephospho-CoA kinase